MAALTMCKIPKDKQNGTTSVKVFTLTDLVLRMVQGHSSIHKNKSLLNKYNNQEKKINIVFLTVLLSKHF